MYNFREYAKSGKSVGGWKGLQVYAIYKKDLKSKRGKDFYIVVDDCNDEGFYPLVGRGKNEWRLYGLIDSEGAIRDRNEVYVVEEKSVKVKYADATTVFNSATVLNAVDAAIVGDVKIGIDVEAVLKHAREMTIDDLLAGFNYGLDVKG